MQHVAPMLCALFYPVHGPNQYSVLSKVWSNQYSVCSWVHKAGVLSNVPHASGDTPIELRLKVGVASYIARTIAYTFTNHSLLMHRLSS